MARLSVNVEPVGGRAGFPSRGQRPDLQIASHPAFLRPLATALRFGSFRIAPFRRAVARGRRNAGCDAICRSGLCPLDGKPARPPTGSTLTERRAIAVPFDGPPQPLLA